MEPPDGAQHYTERLVRLPNLSIYYEPPDAAPAAADRAELGLRAGATVFWCGQSLSKYLPQFDQVFPRIARDAGDCQFAFIQFPGARTSPPVPERLERAFAAFGLNAADHCVVLPRAQTATHSSPPSAPATSSSTASAGRAATRPWRASQLTLPIVTMTGPLMRGRHTTAILNMMGVEDTITATIDDYVATSVRLAQDVQWRMAIKHKISENKHMLYRDAASVSALGDFLNRAVRM